MSVLPLGRRTVESQLLFPRRLAGVGVDIVHFFSHGDAPARISIPQIVTVLDLIPLRFPELYRADKPNWRYKFARWLEYEAVRRSVGVLAISEATKKDCIELLGVEPEKIVVTPLGVSEALLAARRTGPEAKTAQRLSLKLPVDRTLLLYVGGIDPRKNVLFMLDVFAALLQAAEARREAAAGKPMLLLAGAYQKDDQYPRVLERIRALGITDDVRLLGYVPDDSLASLYQAADLFLFPSLYEGFGLPALEAMACGTAVAAGRNSSIPEVVGEVGVLLPDGDLDRWVRSLKELLASPDELERRSAAGIAHAREYSWDHTARLTLEAYRYFAGKHLRAAAEFPGGERRAAGSSA